MNQTIVEMLFGSVLYGTNTENSDIDIKAVHIPDPKDIILQRPQNVINNKIQRPEGEKNTSADVDFESYSLQKYLNLVAEGQTGALDMLFAPPKFLNLKSTIWERLVENKDKLLSKQHKSFVGYCRTQANKYGIKGSRVAAVRLAKDYLETVLKNGKGNKLSMYSQDIERMVENNEHMEFVDIEMLGGVMVRHWSVCNRKLPYTVSVKYAYEIMDALFNEYGKRSLQAESNKGVDWKALSHAVRIAQQAIELLETHDVIFPRPNAQELLAIKTGKLPYTQVAEQIENLLELVENAAEKSTLPDMPNREFIQDFIYHYYMREAIIEWGV